MKADRVDENRWRQMKVNEGKCRKINADEGR